MKTSYRSVFLILITFCVFRLIRLKKWSHGLLNFYSPTLCLRVECVKITKLLANSGSLKSLNLQIAQDQSQAHLDLSLSRLKAEFTT